MTEKLFYKDQYMKEFDSVIEEIRTDDEGLWIAATESAFYPEGGGQPADMGEVCLPDMDLILKVTDVQEKDDIIWHRILPAEEMDIQKLTGMKFHGKIDWDRRFDHMQQHSGEHIVSGIICRKFNCDNVGFHMGEDTVTIDYNVRITYEEALEVEKEANRYLWENHSFVQMWPDEQELKDIDYRSKKELTGNVRITSFPGADTCACCGTHVSSSSEVGLVKFISAKNFHEGSRLELYCGKRAMDFLSMNYDSNKKVAVLLSTKEEKCPELVKKLLDEKIQLKNILTSMESRYLQMWAESLKEKENVLIVDDDLAAEQGRILADLISARISGMAAVMTAAEGGYRYAIIKKGQDISAFIKEMNTVLNGRGGGRDGFAQGSVKAGRDEIEKFFGPIL